MADSIVKFLSKLNKKEDQLYRDIINNILAHNFAMYEVKKLSGHIDLFRIRKGRVRIIFRKLNSDIEVLYIGYRDENTYRKY